MESIAEHRVRQRISAIYDMAHGAQGEGKTIKDYVKTLAESVDIHKEVMGSASDFNKQVGSI